MDRTHQTVTGPNNINVGDIINAELPFICMVEPVKVVQKYPHYLVCERKSNRKVICEPNLKVDNKYRFCVFYFEVNPVVKKQKSLY